MSTNIALDYVHNSWDGRTRRMRVEPAAGVPGGTFLGFESPTDIVRLTPAAARDLGAWLNKRYGLAPYTDAKAGEVVRILPDAERYDGDEVDFPDVTRAKVISSLDSDGEYDVEVLDGDHEGATFYVAAAFVRRLDAILPEDAKPEAPKPTPALRLAVGTPAVIVTDDAQDNTGTRQGLPKGAPVVINGDMPSGSYRVTAHIDGALKTRYVRATDVALTMPAEEPTSALEVGKVYRLLPDSKYAQGSPTYFKPSVTRVKLLTTVLSDGNVRAAAIDGTPGAKWHLDPKYLAPLADAPTTPAAWAVGDEAIVTAGGKYADMLRTGERVRLIVVNGAHTDGTRQVRASSLDRPGTAWFTRTDAIRRP